MTVVYLAPSGKVRHARGICTQGEPIDSRVVSFTPDEPHGRARPSRRVHGNGTRRNPIHVGGVSGTLGDAARSLVSDNRSLFRTLKTHLECGRSTGELDMSRTIVAVAMLGLVATIVIWSIFAQVEPDTAAARAEEGRPTISPFDIMITHGRNAPVEEWRDAF